MPPGSVVADDADVQYNYVLAASLDVGTAFAILFIFIAFGLSNVQINWWGNNVFANSEWRWISGLSCSSAEAQRWTIKLMDRHTGLFQNKVSGRTHGEDHPSVQ